MTATTYAAALAAAKRVGASRADDAGLMALFCESSIQLLCGAVSPQLVWEGAQLKGLTTKELMDLAQDPRAIDDLQWT
jgi:hypothetical protein